VRDGRDEPEDEIDLCVLLEDAAADAGRQGRAWALSLPAAPVRLRGRPLALRRAVVNLLDNAARHGAAPFSVELVSIEVDPAGPGWRVRVGDRGPGVPEDALADLGRPFHRVDRARGSPGTGLGLASVARIAGIHGGGLRLSNRPGGGLLAELFLGVPPG
jgi:two-component system osmolarity sensor histidine kinase EnvZ